LPHGGVFFNRVLACNLDMAANLLNTSTPSTHKAIPLSGLAARLLNFESRNFFLQPTAARVSVKFIFDDRGSILGGRESQPKASQRSRWLTYTSHYGQIDQQLERGNKAVCQPFCAVHPVVVPINRSLIIVTSLPPPPIPHWPLGRGPGRGGAGLIVRWSHRRGDLDFRWRHGMLGGLRRGRISISVLVGYFFLDIYHKRNES